MTEKQPVKGDRPYMVHYDLAYDGGGSEFFRYYRTRFGARWSRWWNVHVFSWGGYAALIGPEEWWPTPTKEKI